MFLGNDLGNDSKNKILVDVLAKLGKMDKRGTGFLRIREELVDKKIIKKLGGGPTTYYIFN